MSKDKRKKDCLASSESVDNSRRKLLRTVGKVAWVAPTLILLSSRKAGAQGPPPPPPPPLGSNEGFGPNTNSARRPKRPRSGGG